MHCDFYELKNIVFCNFFGSYYFYYFLLKINPKNVKDSFVNYVKLKRN